MKDFNSHLKEIIGLIKDLPLDEKVQALNDIREELHKESPFNSEPVDFVRWVKNDTVIANDYNPNKVAPPEMQLLEVSILNDGYTQPIVTFPQPEKIEVVDGFHRSRVGKESVLVKKRVHGYLPIVGIRSEKQDKNSRIASTIRHNRARGKHQVSAMSEIVIELKNRNWKNTRIARELGMDEDEILRLCQISGLEDMFSDKDFSKAWVTDDSPEFEGFTGELEGEEYDLVRIPLENDPERIFHTFHKWEAVAYGLYEQVHPTMSAKQCEYKFIELMTNEELFNECLNAVISEWKFSCEHNLTNRALNRIAWLGQAALAYKWNIPSRYSTGWKLLSDKEQDKANQIALDALNKWQEAHGRQSLTMEEALSFGRQVELY
jgi:ParB-like chromosome segregation protein Spo0J